MPPHHAIVMVGDGLTSVALPENLITPSLDVVHVIADRLAIAAVRELVGEAMVRPVHELVRTFVIVARELPIESQNALLKLFEEPPEASTFILIIPQSDMLLPTLRSRVHVMQNTAPAQVDDQSAFTTFLEGSYANRLDAIADWAKRKDVVAMEAVLRGAEHFASSRAATHPLLLRSVVQIRQYFSQSGAAKKMLLEALALQLPRS